MRQLARSDPAHLSDCIKFLATYPHRETQGEELALPDEPVERVGGQPDVPSCRLHVEPLRLIRHRAQRTGTRGGQPPDRFATSPVGPVSPQCYNGEMVHKRRKKGGRYTAPKHKRYTGRDVELKLTGPKPSDLERHVLRQFVAGGWLRYWPTDLLAMLCMAAANGADTEGDAFADDAESFPLEETVWWEPSDPDDAGRLEETRIHLGRCSDAAGLPPVHTRRDLLTLAEHYGLVRRDDAGRLVMVDPLPLVADTGQLSPEEVAREDKLRWEDQFERLTYRVINIFVDGKLDEWRAPLSEIAEAIEAPVDDTRHALAILGESEEFTVQPDPEAAADGDKLLIEVDWAAFDRNRMHISGYS